MGAKHRTGSQKTWVLVLVLTTNVTMVGMLLSLPLSKKRRR